MGSSTKVDDTASAAMVPQQRFRPHANYFLPGDLVWVHPARLPYWPAEVLDSDEGANRVRARMLHPPAAVLLETNLATERRLWAQIVKRHEEQTRKRQRRGVEQKSGCGTSVSTTPSPAGPSVAFTVPELQADVVTSNGKAVYFFDKLKTPEEVEDCVEDRLKRATHDVSAYEAAFYRAVLHANKYVRVVLSPEKLVPYEVCGVGIVHSFMRSHVSAPRQPHTSTFKPQPAVIRLRFGMENAARDLMGFDYIWVLFQFSYAAAFATGEGQACVKMLQNGTSDSGKDSAKPEVEEVDSATRPASTSAVSEAIGDQMTCWRKRQGITNSKGFKTMIVPPRDDELRGVFATRSPHRPNFIGLSCVRLVAVHGLDVHIADHDLLHGTPVLDIKPYLPFCDSHPDAKAGWVDELEASGKCKGDHKYLSQATLVDRKLDDV